MLIAAKIRFVIKSQNIYPNIGVTLTNSPDSEQHYRQYLNLFVNKKKNLLIFETIFIYYKYRMYFYLLFLKSLRLSPILL